VFRLINYYLAYLGFIVEARWLFTSPCTWIIGLIASAVNYCLSFVWVAAVGVILPAFIVLFLYYFMLEMAYGFWDFIRGTLIMRIIFFPIVLCYSLFLAILRAFIRVFFRDPQWGGRDVQPV
jgi:hypothetical protein